MQFEAIKSEILKKNSMKRYCLAVDLKEDPKLIAEYEGTSAADYPGNNNEYSVSGYHYDIKEV